MRRYPRVLSVQDLSCIGQCSLTAALPVLSACGAECCVLPTAVLSTHTGAEFARPHVRDLTEDMEPVWRSWQAQGIAFDGIQVGYLASFRQLELVSELMDGLRGPETLVLLDPVMGDNGRFYAGFGPDFARGMRALCAKSDIILPNLTEARFLLGDTRLPEAYDETFCRESAQALAELTARSVILTGLECVPGQVSTLICRGETGETQLLSQPKLPGSYHGTGDLFAAACLGLLLRGEPLEQAAERAGAFVAAAIRGTEAGRSYGVRFERCLGMLME